MVHPVVRLSRIGLAMADRMPLLKWVATQIDVRFVFEYVYIYILKYVSEFWTSTQLHASEALLPGFKCDIIIYGSLLLPMGARVSAGLCRVAAPAP